MDDGPDLSGRSQLLEKILDLFYGPAEREGEISGRDRSPAGDGQDGRLGVARGRAPGGRVEIGDDLRAFAEELPDFLELRRSERPGRFFGRRPDDGVELDPVRPDPGDGRLSAS